MKILINTSGMSKDDIDFSGFEKLGSTKYFGEVSKTELYALAADCDAIIVNKVIIDEAFLDACPNIKYVGVFASGYNVVDVAACRARGVTVCNVPGYSTHSVSQHVFALLLCFFGKTDKYINSVANGDWIKSKSFCYFPWNTAELYDKTFGILGYGSIGKAVARIADAFGMKVIVNTRTTPDNCGYVVVDRETLFRQSDILSLHCPLTEQTKNIVNAKTLSLMKQSAVIVNTARGGLIDEAALADALNFGKIAGACLDTVAEEPMLADNPLLGAKNCIITPHIGWAPRETRERLLKIALQNLKSFIDGAPQNVVS